MFAKWFNGSERRKVLNELFKLNESPAIKLQMNDNDILCFRHPGKLSNDAYDRLVKELTGIFKTKVVILEENMQVVVMGMPETQVVNIEERLHTASKEAVERAKAEIMSAMNRGEQFPDLR